MAVRVLVVIVSTNDGHWLARCLAALCSSTLLPAGVIVVENECTDDTRSIAERADCPVQIVRTGKRLGFAGCNNLALRSSGRNVYDYVYLLNPDTVVHESAIERLVGFLEQSSNYGVVGSLQFEYDAENWKTPNEWSRIILQEAADLGFQPRACNGVNVLEHYYVQGSAMLVRGCLFEKLGMFDPVYWTFYEETDFCRRCRLYGLAVGVVMESKVKHFGGGNWKRSPQERRHRDYLYLRNQLIYHLSLPQSGWETFLMSCRLVAKQLRVVRMKLEDVTLPLWRYAFVLGATVARVPEIAKLRKRNAWIMTGAVDRLPSDMVAVGRD